MNFIRGRGLHGCLLNSGNFSTNNQKKMLYTLLFAASRKHRRLTHLGADSPLGPACYHSRASRCASAI